MRTLSLLTLSLAMLVSLPGGGAIAPIDNNRPSMGAALRAKHEALAPQLAASPFGRPLLLAAAESGNRVSGEVHVTLKHPFASASAALADSAQWCEILLLPFNTKGCEASPTTLALLVGRKTTTPIEGTHRLEFRFAAATKSPDYLRVELDAPTGPFGTRDYHIALELVPLDARRSFMRFEYSYAYGTIARAAIGVYLSTVGAKKVGFSVEGNDRDGQPTYIKGVRGIMERNTMRYYLAIEAYLRSLSASPQGRTARMAEDYFAGVERYPRQLHEMEHDEYISMKAREYERMHAASISPARRTASSSPSPS